jgi:hypothetical protein
VLRGSQDLAGIIECHDITREVLGSAAQIPTNKNRNALYAFWISGGTRNHWNQFWEVESLSDVYGGQQFSPD